MGMKPSRNPFDYLIKLFYNNSEVLAHHRTRGYEWRGVYRLNAIRLIFCNVTFHKNKNYFWVILQNKNQTSYNIFSENHWLFMIDFLKSMTLLAATPRIFIQYRLSVNTSTNDANSNS